MNVSPASGPSAALAQFGLPGPYRLEIVTSGLMNRNWRVTRPGPAGDQVWALKQVLDVDADQARFVHRACRDLAWSGVPVPPQKGAELDLDQVSAFVTAYRKITGMPVEPLVDAADRLWWERVCDVRQLKLHYDQQNTSCDHLFRSASALIPWWSSHKAVVTAALSEG